MFTKASKQASLALFLKMGRERDATRRKHLRKNRQNEKRQNSLITDYIRHKHHDVYAEALRFYTGLNDRYPSKVDLRKVDEYKLWKSGVAPILEQEPQPSRPVIPQNQEQESQPSSPVTPQNQEQESQPSSPVTPQNQEQEPQPSSPASEESQSHDKNAYEDNLELRIPIHRYRTIKPVNSINTQTIAIVTEEVIQESAQESAQEQPTTVQIPQIETLEPTLIEELSPDFVEEITNLLREDPDLNNMLNNINEQLNFEKMDIDIAEHSLLEQELVNW